MNILHIITGIQKAAGTSVFCVEICDELKRMGDNVTIAVLNSSSTDTYPSRENVRIVSIDSILNSDTSVTYDILHIHGLWHPILHKARIWASKQAIPIVWSPHGMLTPCALNQKKIKKWVALALYQYWDLRRSSLLHVTAFSEQMDVRRLGLKQPVVIAPLGITVPNEIVSPRCNNPKIALFLGRLHPQKGLFNLVDAWAALKRSALADRVDTDRITAVATGLPQEHVPRIGDRSSKEAGRRSTDETNGSRHNEILSWKVIVAGPDQNGHIAEVMARASHAGVAEDFEITGPVFGEEKDALYAKADLFVLPSFSENFGVVIIEALAHGCPVITTKGAPWAELLGNPNSEPDGQTADDPTASGRCGWWIDTGAKPLAEALMEAINLTDAERYRMGINGRMLAKNKYSWPTVVKQLKVAYESCVTAEVNKAGVFK